MTSQAPCSNIKPMEYSFNNNFVYPPQKYSSYRLLYVNGMLTPWCSETHIQTTLFPFDIVYTYAL